jgi:hypothetical protein
MAETSQVKVIEQDLKGDCFRLNMVLDFLRKRMEGLETSTIGSFLSGTHAARLALNLSAYPSGLLYYETDRTVYYMLSSSAWRYLGGVMRGASVSKPSDLGVPDIGFMYASTDTYTYRWGGAAWGIEGIYTDQIEIYSTGSATQLHLSGTGADDGSYFLSASASQLLLSAGANWDAGASAWRAKATSASSIHLYQGSIYITADTGLTIGATFTPTLVATIAVSTGKLELTNGVKIGTSSAIGDVWTATDTSGNGNWSNALRKCLLARANAYIALTVAAGWLDVTGASVTLDENGLWSIDAVFEFLNPVTGDLASTEYGQLVVDGSAQIGMAPLWNIALLRQTVSQQWTVTVTAQPKVAKLQAGIFGGAGTATCQAINTSIRATFIG